MASTYRTIEELYRTTLVALSESPRREGVPRIGGPQLQAALPEQALVHAQRPDAKAVLELERWGCPVRPAGEARISRNRRVRSPGTGRLRYYFDVSDTAPGAPPARLPLWAGGRSRRRPSSAPSMNPFRG